jgi:hypothetical protein
VKTVRNKKPVKSGRSFFLLPFSFFILDEGEGFSLLEKNEKGRMLG